MSQGCITAIKYFLFLFNLLFFIFGGLVMGIGLWILLDDHSFISVLQESSETLKVGSYILITVGSLTMLMGFLGCIGAIYEVRCLLGLYFTCLALILLAQMASAVLVYFQRDLLKSEMSHIVKKVMVEYTGGNKTTEQALDYIQRTINCCGWNDPTNWTENAVIKNSSLRLYPCSCRNASLPGVDMQDNGLCDTLVPEWPVYTTGCITIMESWIFSNSAVITGICIGVAVTELLGMILSMCLCRSIQQEEYSKVPVY